MSRRKKILTIGVVGIVMVIVVSVIGAIHIHLAPVFTLVLYAGLIGVTMLYVYFASETAEATRGQADASVKMAKEMREQRLMTSQPIIIQKAIFEKEVGEGSTSNYFSHFVVYNAGNGPAIELEISLVNKEMTPLHAERKTFLRAGEPPIKFTPFNLGNLEESTTYYLVCECQSIFSRGPQKTWYQTWLPFEPVKSSKEGKIYVKPGELKFCEVSEKDRIDAFGSRSKPK